MERGKVRMDRMLHMHLRVRARRAKETSHSVTELHHQRSEVMEMKETIGNNFVAGAIWSS
jgi:hypothetical protein